jgi:hypothetical protein
VCVPGRSDVVQTMPRCIAVPPTVSTVPRS